MARQFVRTSSERIRYPNLPDLSGAAQVAVSFWAYNVDGASYDYIVNHMDAGLGDGLAFQLESSVTPFVAARNGSSSPFHAWGSAISHSAWIHFLAQYDGTEGTPANRIRLYVNGSLLGSPYVNAAPPTTLGSTSALLTLGHGESRYWTGSLADVAIWAGVVLDSTDRTNLSAGRRASTVQAGSQVFYDTLAVGSTPTNLITSEAATVTGTTEVADPVALDALSAGGQPLMKRHGGVLHASGASPLGHRRW
jgi:hypothetical protein